MSDENKVSDYIADLPQEIQEISKMDLPQPTDKFHENIVAPLTKGIRAAHERFQTFYETGVQHSKMLTQYTDPYVEQIDATIHENMSLFHKYRRKYPWEMVGASTALVTIASLPFGAHCATRNLLMTSFITTAMTNPEYLYDKYHQFRNPGSTTIDSTNKNSFRF